MEVDSQPPSATNDSGEPSEQTRPNAIHIVGVDDLNTADIEDLLVSYYNKPFQIEWIDDTSLNIVYDDENDAHKALLELTDPQELEGEEYVALGSIPPTSLRKLRAHPKKAEAELRARIAKESDKKANGSRARSRYYLLHGEPSRREDLARFGTKRSNPMKYGFKGRDILTESKREDRVGDLFPEKAPRVALDDLGEEDDLFYGKIKSRSKRGSRGGQRRRRQKGLNAEQGSGPKKASDDRSSVGQPASTAAAANPFQNMDY